MSSEMLTLAKIRAEKEGCVDSLSFVLGDARNFRVDENFDAIISLFHVLSYQTTDADLDAMINTASCHLKQDGIFVFDFWYGPAVLWQRPASRVKKLCNKSVEITRFADSKLWDETNAVDVNYSIFVKDLVTNEINEINEIHRMRYLFLLEVDRLLENNGFSRVSSEEWLTGNTPSVDTWGVCVVARKY
jgi:SAM-dependent methyltransferase